MISEGAAHVRDDEDAAVVVAVLTALAAAATQEPPVPARSLWGSLAHRLGTGITGPHGWWASGMPR